jgi:hypothetical protein
VTQTELSLKRFKDVTLDSDQTVERLRKCHEREQQYAEEHFQDDMNALEAVKVRSILLFFFLFSFSFFWGNVCLDWTEGFVCRSL